MAKKKPARKKAAPKDTQQIARSVLDAATPGAEAKPAETEKNPAAVALGRLGGLVGGRARAEKLTAKKRAEIARLAAQARWANAKEGRDGTK